MPYQILLFVRYTALLHKHYIFINMNNSESQIYVDVENI
jgi:hypothetical protein